MQDPLFRSYGVICAEFLSSYYLARLRIFSLSTCVGYEYGQRNVKLEAFLGSMNTDPSLIVLRLSLPITAQCYSMRIFLHTHLTA